MIRQLLREGIRFVSKNDLPTIVRAFHSRDAHASVQFVKYGLCGVAALITHNVLAYLFGYWFFPFFGDPAVALTDTQRSDNQTIANLIAFPFGNAVAYTTNALWVFHGGRHSRFREFCFFTAISFLSFLVGILGGPLLVRYGLNEHLAQAGFVVTSALVNYLCRKFLVFLK